MKWGQVGLVALLCVAAATGVGAQTESAGAGARVRAGSEWRALRVAKWTSLAGTTAAAIYGVRANLHADDLYDELERACVAEPLVCTLRDREGHYIDDALEAQYQEVKREDRRARNALLASQVGVAATVVLFVIDLRNARAPADIPYHPPALQIAPDRGGGVRFSYRVTAGKVR